MAEKVGMAAKVGEIIVIEHGRDDVSGWGGLLTRGALARCIAAVVRNMRVAGRAFTIRMVPVGQSRGSVGDCIDDVAAGKVVIIDNDGHLDATIWGDILTWVAAQKGVAGSLIDGVCRDTDRCVELNYPVFARGHTMRTAKDWMTADAYNVTVQIAGVRVEPDDWVVGDADGVVIIPADRMEKVLDIAEEKKDRKSDQRSSPERTETIRRSGGFSLSQTTNSRAIFEICLE
jgi:regulator of RNase E activity RraA